MPASTLASAAQIVQLALTPIFLLTGIASMLNVFTTRLGRVADRVDRLTANPVADPDQLARLRRRSRLLDLAVVMAAGAGALTCCAALTLFLGALRDTADGTLLFALFGGALACAIVALIAFAGETLMSGRSMREQGTAPEGS